MNINRQEVIKNAASAHRQTLLQSLKHRLEIARSKGDDRLIQQLEVEASYLASR
jgi:hypothetical protein